MSGECCGPGLCPIIPNEKVCGDEKECGSVQGFHQHVFLLIVTPQLVMLRPNAIGATAAPIWNTGGGYL